MPGVPTQLGHLMTVEGEESICLAPCIGDTAEKPGGDRCSSSNSPQSILHRGGDKSWPDTHGPKLPHPTAWENAKKSTPEPGGQAILNMLWLSPPSHGKERRRIKYNVDVSK